MLEEFIVDNYKSLINVTFHPREQNLLLGLNNAGKTNLCQAMTFFSATSGWSLDQCADQFAGGRIGITNHYFDKSTIDFRVRATVPFESENIDFDYRLSISSQASPQGIPSLEVEEETLFATCSGFDGVRLLENTREGVRILHEVDYLRGEQRYMETGAPRDTTMLQRLYDLENNPRAHCFKRYLASWQYLSLSAEALRLYQHTPNQTILARDGRNLASLLYQLKTGNERQYRRLLEPLRKIAPEIDVINFVLSSEDTVFMVFEDNKGNQFPAAGASSGTLRFLALIYVLLAQPSLAQSPLIMIEEPENGLYVAFLRELLTLVEEAESRPQLVFTTHSPYFIDLFENQLDGVFMMNRGERSSSLTQLNINEVKARMETYSLGEQHFREMLR